MNSRLYECSVMHHRFTPKVHHFQHDIFMFYLDLDELDAISRGNFLFGRNQSRVYNFRDADHEPAGDAPLKQRIITFVQKRGIALDASARVMLLTFPRVFGYVFNPISVYFCFAPDGKPACAVAEVGNTFREMKLYLLAPGDLDRSGVFDKLTPKHFYVSPFSSLDLNFLFRLKVPGDKLDLKVDDLDGDNRVLVTTLSGASAPLTTRKLGWFTLKYPLVTLKVIFLIHWHALLLWLKRAPFYRKSANAALQRDVLRPHSAALAAKIK